MDSSASHFTASITSAYLPVVTVIPYASFGPLRVLIAMASSNGDKARRA